MEISRLRRAKSVMSQHGKFEFNEFNFEFNALLDGDWGADEDAKEHQMSGCHKEERDQQ